jgi:ABC-type transport system involved in Fe-S cluster assembly fused permease/ATPase subunit
MKLYKSANPDDYEVIEEQHVESITVDFTPITHTITKLISLSILLSIPIALFTFAREYFAYVIICILAYCAYYIIVNNTRSDTVYDRLQVIRSKRPDLAQSIENLERVVRSIEKKSGERIV